MFLDINNCCCEFGIAPVRPGALVAYPVGWLLSCERDGRLSFRRRAFTEGVLRYSGHHFHVIVAFIAPYEMVHLSFLIAAVWFCQHFY